MNMFGVGPLELAVILIVALVFVGPDRLPRLAADLARTIREIRKYTGSLAAEFNEVVKDVGRETAGEKTLCKDVTEGIGGATRQMSDVVREVRTDAFGQSAAVGSNGHAAGQPQPPTDVPKPAEVASAETASWVDISDPDADEVAEAPRTVAQ
jgi:Sec-independent protein translocase protein TatA